VEKLNLAINNGLVINANGRQKMNVGISKGRIEVLSELPLQADRVIDATGKWVIPGVIDSHVHFTLKQGQGDDVIMSEDDYETGPIASAVGGVTTFIDFAITPRAQSPISFMKERVEMANIGSCIDFSFHAGVTNPNPKVLEEFPEIVKMGIPSFKFFLNYKAWGFAVDLGFLMDVFKTLRELGGVVCVHCENDEIIEYLRRKHAKEPEMINHSITRPDFSEEIAIGELIALARETDSRLYIVHLSTEKGLNLIRLGQAEGLRLRTETCPHYLEFSDEIYLDSKGLLYTMTPPLRPKGNSEALWRGIAEGIISVVASDHNAFGKESKENHPHWLDVPPGIGGSEMILTYLHSQGVNTGRITPEHMVSLISTNPAIIYGVPNKGSVKVGFDADLVVFDPESEREVHFEELATPGGFTIFEGMKMIGWPIMTISRGKVIVENRKFVGQKGSGKFIERVIDPQAW
jgi:dihydropyrimidinase